jgi:rhodanese-related sulfurtransferase
MSVTELGDALEGESPPVVVDVRGSGDFGMGHVPGARWLARGKLELDAETIMPDKQQPVVVVCDTGVRSALGAATLRSMGYADVRYLTGGLAAWKQAGQPITDGLEGANVTLDEAQADFGSTVWTGALGRSFGDMERYLSWEEALVRH